MSNEDKKKAGMTTLGDLETAVESNPNVTEHSLVLMLGRALSQLSHPEESNMLHPSPAEVTDNVAAGAKTIVVLARGFVFVCDSWDGVTLRGVHNVRSWANGGLGGLTQGAKTSEAVLDEMGCDIAPRPGAVLFVGTLPVGWLEK